MSTLGKIIIKIHFDPNSLNLTCVIVIEKLLSYQVFFETF